MSERLIKKLVKKLLNIPQSTLKITKLLVYKIITSKLVCQIFPVAQLCKVYPIHPQPEKLHLIRLDFGSKIVKPSSNLRSNQMVQLQVYLK